jgi:hypothetical protein
MSRRIYRAPPPASLPCDVWFAELDWIAQLLINDSRGEVLLVRGFMIFSEVVICLREDRFAWQTYFWGPADARRPSNESL